MNPYNNSHFMFVNKSFKEVEFACTGVSIPGISLNATIQASRYSDVKHPGDKLEYEDLSLEFLVDEELKNYQEISDWLKSIESTSYSKINETISDSKIIINDSSHKLIGTYTFKDSFPVSLSSIQLSVDETGVVFPRATVSLTYTSYEFKISS
jgi:hypothetical protein